MSGRSFVTRIFPNINFTIIDYVLRRDGSNDEIRLIVREAIFLFTTLINYKLFCTTLNPSVNAIIYFVLVNFVFIKKEKNINPVLLVSSSYYNYISCSNNKLGIWDPVFCKELLFIGQLLGFSS